MIAIEIGAVPSSETPGTDSIGGLLQAAAFLRQLKRMRPVLPESELRYIIQITTKRHLGYTIVLVGAAGGFEQANLALELAESALEITHWDAQALAELENCGQLRPLLVEIEPALKCA